jgi:hypothetical protein
MRSSLGTVTGGAAFTEAFIVRLASMPSSGPFLMLFSDLDHRQKPVRVASLADAGNGG